MQAASIATATVSSPTTQSRCVVLQNWYVIGVRRGPDSTWTGAVAVEGIRQLGDGPHTWHSSPIASRISNRRLTTASGSIYVLEGALNVARFTAEGWSMELLHALAHGFPPNWQTLFARESLATPAWSATPSPADVAAAAAAAAAGGGTSLSASTSSDGHILHHHAYHHHNGAAWPRSATASPLPFASLARSSPGVLIGSTPSSSLQMSGFGIRTSAGGATTRAGSASPVPFVSAASALSPARRNGVHGGPVIASPKAIMGVAHVGVAAETGPSSDPASASLPSRNASASSLSLSTSALGVPAARSSSTPSLALDPVYAAAAAAAASLRASTASPVSWMAIAESVEHACARCLASFPTAPQLAQHVATCLTTLPHAQVDHATLTHYHGDELDLGLDAQQDDAQHQHALRRGRSGSAPLISESSHACVCGRDFDMVRSLVSHQRSCNSAQVRHRIYSLKQAADAAAAATAAAFSAPSNSSSSTTTTTTTTTAAAATTTTTTTTAATTTINSSGGGGSGDGVNVDAKLGEVPTFADNLATDIPPASASLITTTPPPPYTSLSSPFVCFLCSHACVTLDDLARHRRYCMLNTTFLRVLLKVRRLPTKSSRKGLMLQLLTDWDMRHAPTEGSLPCVWCNEPLIGPTAVPMHQLWCGKEPPDMAETMAAKRKAALTLGILPSPDGAASKKKKKKAKKKATLREEAILAAVPTVPALPSTSALPWLSSLNGMHHHLLLTTRSAAIMSSLSPANGGATAASAAAAAAVNGRRYGKKGVGSGRRYGEGSDGLPGKKAAHDGSRRTSPSTGGPRSRRGSGSPVSHKRRSEGPFVCADCGRALPTAIGRMRHMRYCPKKGSSSASSSPSPTTSGPRGRGKSIPGAGHHMDHRRRHRDHDDDDDMDDDDRSLDSLSLRRRSSSDTRDGRRRRRRSSSDADRVAVAAAASQAKRSRSRKNGPYDGSASCVWCGSRLASDHGLIRHQTVSCTHRPLPAHWRDQPATAMYNMCKRRGLLLLLPLDERPTGPSEATTHGATLLQLLDTWAAERAAYRRNRIRPNAGGPPGTVEAAKGRGTGVRPELRCRLCGRQCKTKRGLQMHVGACEREHYASPAKTAGGSRPQTPSKDGGRKREREEDPGAVVDSNHGGAGESAAKRGRQQQRGRRAAKVKQMRYECNKCGRHLAAPQGLSNHRRHCLTAEELATNQFPGIKLELEPIPVSVPTEATITEDSVKAEPGMNVS